MTLVEERPPGYAPTRYARWAWIAMGLVPVGLVVGIVASMAGEGEGHGVSGAVGGALIGVLCLATPTLAVIFAGAAVAVHEPAGRPALAVSVPLLAATVVLLPVIAIGAIGWLISLAVTAAVVGSYFAFRFCR